MTASLHLTANGCTRDLVYITPSRATILGRRVPRALAQLVARALTSYLAELRPDTIDGWPVLAAEPESGMRIEMRTRKETR